MSFTIRLRKESFKFSGSHFTIFSETTAERLHGHNYYVAVDIAVDDISEPLGIAFDFNDVKPTIKHLCDELDEYVLIPESSPNLKIKTSAREVEVVFAKKRYVFPIEDVRLLPLVNLTTEELARYFAVELRGRLSDILSKNRTIRKLAVSIKETQGQTVTFSMPW